METFCLVPPELEAKLLEPLRRHFADTHVQVVIERRGTERRAGIDRRTSDTGPPKGRAERRRVRNQPDRGGRRVGERRAGLIPVDSPEGLPRKARLYMKELSFCERVTLTEEQSEDLDTARLVIRIQADGKEQFAALYERYFDRIYAYLRVMLKDSHGAEDATQQVFIQVFEALASYERRERPFRAWLFTIARNYASRQLRRRERVDVLDPARISDRQDETPAPEPELPVLSWLSDTDLSVLIERLPAAQRQVLALRYMLDLQPAEIAEILDCSANHVSVLQYRALAFLRARLTALGRRPVERRSRPRMRRAPQHANILRRRRFALTP